MVPGKSIFVLAGVAGAMCGCSLVFTADELCFKEDIGCPSSGDWETFPESCSCYIGTDSFRNFEEATALCEREGVGGYRAHLLTVETSEERAFIEDGTNLRDDDDGIGDSFRLGLVYVDQTWTWITGEPLDLDSVQDIFEPPTEPASDETCTRFARNLGNRWIVSDCSAPSGAETICELDGREPKVEPPPR